ncbi:MAG: Stp1/IreP family PP2C-type Ser/Thr phosphatase [Acidimicrobiales bacterium]
MTTFQWGAATHAGRVRAMNQDAVHAANGLFVVADGMGGHQAGETASRIAVEVMAEGSYKNADELAEGLTAANLKIFETASNRPDLEGMGTTVCAMALVESTPPSAVLVNVGDSRAYRMHAGEFTQLTIDHSYVAELVRSGALTKEEAATHPYRNMVTRSVGIDSEVDVDSWGLELDEGDRFLLCSDGLFGEVKDDDIADLLRANENPEDAARALIAAANAHGGRDNISVIVLDVQADADSPLQEGLVTGEVMVIDELGEDGNTGEAALFAGEPTMPMSATRPIPGQTAPAPLATPSPDIDTPPQTTRNVEPNPQTERQLEETDQSALQKPLTWRFAGVTSAIVIGLVVLIAAFGLWARQGTYVGFSGDEVVVYQGRPGGLLWFEPTINTHTGVYRQQLPEDVATRVENNIRVDNPQEAQDLVAEYSNNSG